VIDDLSLAKDLLKEMDEEINEKTKIIKSVETEMEAIRKGKEPTRVHALSEDGDAVSRMSGIFLLIVDRFNFH
jgi:hypothetical protein